MRVLRGDEYKTLTTLNEYQKEVAEKTLQQWSDVANVKFTKKDNNMTLILNLASIII